jgi:hypothetical protein
VPEYIQLGPYGGSYKGLDVQRPAIFLDPAETPSTSNFWFRNSELRSLPAFSRLFPGPEQGNAPLGQNNFRDTNGVTHTVGFGVQGLYQLNYNNLNPTKYPWSFLGGEELQAGIPCASQVYANQIYYTNGSPFLQSWDGIELSPSLASTVSGGASIGSTSGPGNIGAYFLYELNNQVILLNLVFQNSSTEVETTFPQSMWWSANGIPNQFDFSVNPSAGNNTFLDVPDQFTGVMALGPVAYLFRTNGITEQSIGGSSAAQPFIFDHLWASDRGIGNIYPWSIAQYGSTGFCISTEQIFLVTISNFSPVGGGARDAIMADLAEAIANPVASVIPDFSYGFIYLTYWICIPMSWGTRCYIFSVEDQNWAVSNFDGIVVTGKPSSCWR